jgi:hypothetical protein
MGAGRNKAIAAITSALKFNDEYADEFKNIWAGISSVLEVVEKNALKIIGVLGKILTMDVSGAINDVKDLGNEFSEAAKDAYQLSAAANQLEDDWAKFNVSELAIKNKIDELILQSKLSNFKCTRLLKGEILCII